MKLGEILPFRRPKHTAVIIPFPIERTRQEYTPLEEVPQVIDITKWKIDHRRDSDRPKR